MDFYHPNRIATDIAILVSSGIIFQLTETLCRKKVFPLIATQSFNLNKEILIQNFSKQAWKFIWHSTCLILELAIFVNSDCWISIMNPYNAEHGTSLFWTNTNGLPTTMIRLLYLLQTGYYLTNLVYMFCIEPPNDLLTMAAHHTATIGLIIMSYLPVSNDSHIQPWKIGAAIMFIHEIGDVTLALCKALHYAQSKSLQRFYLLFTS